MKNDKFYIPKDIQMMSLEEIRNKKEKLTRKVINQMNNNKKGEWFLVCGENFMSIQPQYSCSKCNNMISTYYPPSVCEHCGSINEYKGNSISVSIEDEKDILVNLTPEEVEIIRIGIDVAQFECQLPETNESKEIKRLLIKLGLLNEDE